MISLVSDMTDRKSRRAHGWLFFDAECDFCQRIAGLVAGPLRRRGMRVAPLQDPRVGALLGLRPQELLRAVRFMSADGSQWSGADALIKVAGEFWWARPLAWMGKIPLALAAMQAGYRWGAARWHCRGDRCLEDGLGKA